MQKVPSAQVTEENINWTSFQNFINLDFKGHHQQSKKITYRIAENACKSHI